MLDHLWPFLKDPANQKTLGWLGGGVVVAVGGVWAAVKYLIKPSDGGGKGNAVRADRGGIAIGGDVSGGSIQTGRRDHKG